MAFGWRRLEGQARIRDYQKGLRPTGTKKNERPFPAFRTSPWNRSCGKRPKRSCRWYGCERTKGETEGNHVLISPLSSAYRWLDLVKPTSGVPSVQSTGAGLSENKEWQGIALGGSTTAGIDTDWLRGMVHVRGRARILSLLDVTPQCSPTRHLALEQGQWAYDKVCRSYRSW